MAGDVNYDDLAADAVAGMHPNSKRSAHYHGFKYSPLRLLDAILRRPEVITARLSGHRFDNFCVTIEVNSTKS